MERLKEGGSATDVTSGSSNNPLSPPASAASSSAAASASDADAAVAARLSDLDLRRVNVETEAVQRTSPTRAAATALAATSTASSASSTAPTTADGDHFLTLKNVKGGFCLDKKLEKKVNKRSRCSGVADEEDEEPWLKPPLDLDEFDYDFSLEKSVLRDFS